MAKIALTTDTHYGISPKTCLILEKFLIKLASEDFDVLIHTGDWISHKQAQMEKVFKLFRKHINKPILGVLGNHDLWDQDSWGHNNKRAYKQTLQSYEEMKVQQRSLMQQYEIDYLQDLYPYIFEDKVAIYGFDGWYHYLPPPSNDHYFMPQFIKNCPADQYLNYRAYKTLDAILLHLDELKISKPHLKTVCVTHHPPYNFDPVWLSMSANPQFMEVISEKFNYFFVGHSHKNEDWLKGSCRVVNAGSDYNRPNYKIIEVL